MEFQRTATKLDDEIFFTIEVIVNEIWLVLKQKLHLKQEEKRQIRGEEQEKQKERSE